VGSTLSRSPQGTRVPYRVLHVLDHSWPVLDGYSQRSRSLLAAQLHLGFLPSALTSPLHAQDDPSASELLLDSIHYFRTPCGTGCAARAIRSRWPVLREGSVIRLLRRRIEYLLDAQSFDILHSHSPALCGLASLQAANSRGIPFVYEIRSFWEDSNLSRGNNLQHSVRYRFARALESYVARRAHAIVGISRSILKDIAARGVPADRLFHIPNGVDVVRFVPRERDFALARGLGIESMPTFGYLGTLFPWEGVPWLVHAAAELHRRGLKFKLLIAGDGADAESVKRAIEETQSSAFVQYLGRIPHDQVERYYSVMDVLVYPRLRTRLTDMVTPLKPLEAMALAKTVLASAVNGHRELIEPEVTGVLFDPENSDDFCRNAVRLMQEPHLRCLGEQARKKMFDERDWNVIARGYENVYDAATRKAQS
jgi:glycogen(starch) synthase